MRAAYYLEPMADSPNRFVCPLAPSRLPTAASTLRRAAVAFLAQRLQRRHGAQHAARRQDDHSLGAFAKLGPQLERTPVQRHKVVDDGQAEACSTLRRLVRQGALAEGLHDLGN